MRVPKVEYIFKRPKFVWTSPCDRCPSKFGTDPEVQDILKLSLYRRLRSAFACAWRREGYCHCYYKKMIGGENENINRR